MLENTFTFLGCVALLVQMVTCLGSGTPSSLLESLSRFFFSLGKNIRSIDMSEGEGPAICIGLSTAYSYASSPCQSAPVPLHSCLGMSTHLHAAGTRSNTICTRYLLA